jgi:hypothetical protein
MEEYRLRVFQNRVMRRVFGPKRDEVTGECRKHHNDELCDLYSSPNILQAIKSRTMIWVGHVARTGRKETFIGFGGKTWGDQSIDGRLILRWIFRNWDVGVWTGLDWLRIETVGDQL